MKEKRIGSRRRLSRLRRRGKRRRDPGAVGLSIRVRVRLHQRSRYHGPMGNPSELGSYGQSDILKELRERIFGLWAPKCPRVRSLVLS